MRTIAKTEDTEILELGIRLVTSKMGTFGCHEVTIGFGGSERVDYMTVDTKGIWRCYEIKTSLSDFRSKAKLSFVGHYNYFVLTPELFEKVKNEIPKEIGVYVGKSPYNMKCVKNAKKRELLVDENILLMSMIRSLSRDAEKLQKIEDPKVIERYNRRIRNLEKERDSFQRSYTTLSNALFRKFGRNWREEIGLDNT